MYFVFLFKYFGFHFLSTKTGGGFLRYEQRLEGFSAAAAWPSGPSGHSSLHSLRPRASLKHCGCAQKPRSVGLRLLTSSRSRSALPSLRRFPAIPFAITRRPSGWKSVPWAVRAITHASLAIRGSATLFNDARPRKRLKSPSASATEGQHSPLKKSSPSARSSSASCRKRSRTSATLRYS